MSLLILAAPPPEGRQYGLHLVPVPPFLVPVPVRVRVGVRNDIYFKSFIPRAFMLKTCPIGVKITLKRRLT